MPLSLTTIDGRQSRDEHEPGKGKGIGEQRIQEGEVSAYAGMSIKDTAKESRDLSRTNYCNRADVRDSIANYLKPV